MSVGILWVLSDYLIEICNCLLVVFDHLVGFCSLVNILYFRWNYLNALRERVDGLLKLLDVAVSEADVVVDVRLVRNVGLVLKGVLKGAHAFLELGVGVVAQSKLVQDLRIISGTSPFILKTFPEVRDG